MYCSKCGSAVGTSDRYCSKCGATVQHQIEPARVPVVATPDLSDRIASSFRDPTKLTTWLKYFLYASIVINAIALFSGVLLYQLLTDLKSGVYTSKALATAAWKSIVKTDQTVAVFDFVILITTIVLFCMWIHRANSNARQLGAKGMAFTPGWAVGWYFVPFANLWKPYQAMKEIWRASKNPDAWKNEQRGAILPWWWFFFIVTHIFGYASLRTSRKAIEAEEIDELLTATGVALASDLVTIPATIIAIVLVRQIYEMQMTHAQHRI